MSWGTRQGWVWLAGGRAKGKGRKQSIGVDVGTRREEERAIPRKLQRFWTEQLERSCHILRGKRALRIGRNSPFGCLSSTIGICKSKCLTKGSKKEAKKKHEWLIRFLRKVVKAAAMFQIRNFGKTLVTRTLATPIASDGLEGHLLKWVLLICRMMKLRLEN